MARHADTDGDGRADHGLTAVTLRAAMGGALSLERYQTLLPAFTKMLVQANATTVKRAAMLAAQVAHESVGLRYSREIWGPNAQQLKYDPASGSSLSKQLGNTKRGDGYSYRGAGWLQVTGANNFRAVSRWAYDRGLVPTSIYFVDHPDELGSDRYVWLGPTWYWVAARPQLNSLADAGNVLAATKAVNGGTYGLADRTARYNACLALGGALLPGAPPAQADTSLSRRQSLLL